MINVKMITDEVMARLAREATPPCERSLLSGGKSFGWGAEERSFRFT